MAPDEAKCDVLDDAGPSERVDLLLPLLLLLLSPILISESLESFQLMSLNG